MGDGKFVLKGYGSNVVGSFGSGSMVQDMPSAMQLNGTDAYANGSTNMATVTGTTATISMWVYYTGSQTNQGEKVLFSDSSSETRKILMQTRNYSSHNTSFRYGYVDSDGGGVAAKDTGGSAGVLTSGTWQHFCLVADGRSVSLHVDGEQYSDATYSAAGTNSYAITTPHLGRAAFSDGRYFPGYIRNVQVYNVSSSDAQVVELMNDEFPHGTPIHWWTCNDGATNDDGSATDSDLTLTNTVEDKSFYKLNQIGTASVSGSVTVSGGTWNLKNNTYIRPTGTNNTNANYIQLNNDQQYDGSRSYAMWFYLGATGNTQIVLDNYLSNAGTRVFINGGTTSLYLRLNNANVINFAANENEWNHLVWTIDETNNLAKGYLNGIEVTSAANDRTYGTVNNMRIGAQTDDDYPTNDGNYISEYAYYASVLTPEQIDLLYKGQWTGRPETWLKMDEGTGTTITNHGTDGATATLTGVSANLPVWVKPDYDVVEGVTTIAGAALSAPRGVLSMGGANWGAATFTHNNGTVTPTNAGVVEWEFSSDDAGSDNALYNLATNAAGQMRFTKGYIVENIHSNSGGNGYNYLCSNRTYNYGTTSSAASSSALLRSVIGTATNYANIYGVSKLYPVKLKYWDETPHSTNVALKNVKVEDDIETNKFAGGDLKVRLDGDCEFDEVKVVSGETFDLNGQRAEFNGNLDMESGVTFVGSGALLVCNDKIKTDGATVYNSGTSVICGHDGTSTIRFNSGEWENLMYNPTGGGVTFDTNANVANNLIVAGGYYDMQNVHLSGDGVGTLQIVGGAEFKGGDGVTHKITDTFNSRGGLLGTSALEFNGSSESAANASATTWGFGSSFSIELWFKTSFNGSSCLLDFAESSGNDNRIQVLQTASEMAFKLWNSGGSSFQIGTTAFTINPDDGKWHHLAFTSDGSTQKIYYDGRLAGEASHTIARDADPTMKLTIGMHATLGSHYSGYMDELRFFSDVRTESELRTDMFQGGTLADSGALVARYKFDEGENTTLANSEGTTARNLAASGDGVWIPAGTFSYETCTLEFDNVGGTCNLYAPLSGGPTPAVSGLTITSGTTMVINNPGRDFYCYGPLVNSGTTTASHNFQYRNRATPLVGPNSDLKLGGKIFYYFSDGTANYVASGAGADYYQMRPGTTVFMQGDFDVQNDIIQSGGELHLNGYTANTNSIMNYGGGDIYAEPGSSIAFDSTDGFEKSFGTSPTDMLFVASGEACVQFYGDDNDGYGNYITLPKTSALDFGNSAFTITFWTKLGDDADEEYIISNMNSSDSAWPGFRFGLKHGDLNNQINDNVGGGVENRFDTNIATDTWKHIAIVVSGSGADMVCYVDGSAPVAGQSLGTYASLNNDKTVKIGGAYAGDTQSFNGSLADIRFYKSALSAANITTLSSENPAISVSGAYADPDNALSATVWLKLGMTPSGTMDLKNYGTSGSANDGTWVTSGSPPRLGKSGIVTISSSATPYNPINNLYPASVTLRNVYMSGSKDIIAGQRRESSAGYMAVSSQVIKTEGTVVLD